MVKLFADKNFPEMILGIWMPILRGLAWGEISRARTYLNSRASNVNLYAVEARHSQGIRGVSQFVLALNFRCNPIQLVLQFLVRPMGVADAAGVA